mgnify:CR=1 FL=1
MSEKAIYTRKFSTERKQKDFFTENFPLYLQFDLKYIADEEVCKDIVQEAFIKYWKQENNFKDEVNNERLLLLLDNLDEILSLINKKNSNNITLLLT